MTNDVHFFAIVRDNDSENNPSGLARRTLTDEGRLDEVLSRDFSWHRDPVIYEWERGEEMGTSLVEISEDEAERLIERFREEWDQEG